MPSGWTHLSIGGGFIHTLTPAISEPQPNGRGRAVEGRTGLMNEYPDFWKYYPERWLLSDKVRNMHHIAHSGYRFLCDHCMMAHPPGILPYDNAKLREWARMSLKEWRRYSGAILGSFEVFVSKRDGAETEWLGQTFIMDIFRQWDRQRYDLSYAGIRAVYARKDRNRDSAPILRPYTDPYAPFTKKVMKLLTTQPPISDSAACSVEESRREYESWLLSANGVKR